MVTEHVLGFIQRRFEASFDIVESLQNGKVKTYTQPTLSQSGTATVQAPAPAPSSSKILSPLKVPSEATVAVAIKEEKMIFKIDYDLYVKKKELYENNIIKAYATIFEYCSKTIQARIRELSDYESKIRNNPIELMKAIKELMHSPIRAKYAFATLTDAFERLLNIKQQENKGLLDYTSRFKQEQDILKEYVGKDILHTFVEHTDEYKAVTTTGERKNLKDGSFNR